MLAAKDTWEGAMRRFVGAVLVLAAIGSVMTVTGTASAQRNGTASLSNGPDISGIDNARRIEENAKRALEKIRKDGLAALQAQDYAKAERTFDDLLSKNPTTLDAHFLMGLAKMGLKKWAEAKEVLQIAITEEPNRPEPRARLGVANIMVNDMEGAMAQRAALASMSANCSVGCADSQRIKDNLAMIDKVLAAIAPKPAATPAPTAAPPPPATPG